MASATANRRLTTILAADVVGYSRLMAADEEATLNTLRAYRAIIYALVEKHNGRVFNTAGDAVLAEFGSAVEAVRCGISIQEDLGVRNAELPDDSQMWFRIGINVGDVMVEDGDLFGDGVNIAARLEGLAEQGGICISGSTFEQVRNKVSFAFDDIGMHQVKNIPDPVSAFRLVPGKVDVKDGRKSGGARSRPAIAGANFRWLFIAGAIVLTVALGGAVYLGLLPIGPGSKHPFDGHWKVTVSSLSGCRNNEPRTFAVNVEQGKIDEGHHPFPKIGGVSRNGEFNIKATDRAGNVMNTQTGTVTGDVGKGRFQGRRTGCNGVVTLVRLD